ncbi:DUF305 domain-containing protein [Micromonospora aurantiaca (nom. illeg.)]|uniref:DUF305 domain-containing protein n=1 Tax=Micromonospora aurantiaca (nom. illeg.) TaxID=47850 RepID=UPI003F49B5C4
MAALGVFALGLAVGLIAPTTRAPADNSAEAGFARDMATHHAQAVEMSMIAHAGTDDPEVATLSMDIALTQQAQIGTMRAWLTEWKLSLTGTQPPMSWMTGKGGMTMNHGGGTPASTAMPGMATKAEVSRLREATGRDLDLQFTELMIRHHQGGITMVNAVLAAEPRQQVRDLAERMRAGQEAELNALQSLLARLKAAPARNASTD